jgi:Ca-activated chloride channel family protein
MTKMAVETNGKFFRAIREDSLAGVFKVIDSLEKTKVEVSNYTRYDEYFSKYLAISIMLFLISWVLSSSILRRAP